MGAGLMVYATRLPDASAHSVQVAPVAGGDRVDETRRSRLIDIFSRAHPVDVEPFPHRHPRESGDPGRATCRQPLGSRFRGNDDVRKYRFHFLEIFSSRRRGGSRLRSRGAYR